MQRIGYGISDFYISWTRMKKGLSRLIVDSKFDLAQILSEKMDIRAPSLFKTPLMVCAVYLDLRIMFKLSTDQRTTAAMDLLKIHERLTDKTPVHEEDHLDDTLDEIQQEYRSQYNANNVESDHVLEEIAKYESEDAYNIRAPVMEFWEANENKYPKLTALARVLHAVPSNQSCTERSFSSFSYIRSKHRMCMTSENLSNVLLVRLNKDIFYELRKENIQNILG